MKWPRILLAGGVAAALASAPGGIAAAHAAAAPAACQTVHIPVILPVPEPEPSPGQVVSALLCTPADPAPGRPLVVTVPGATYTSLYWRWPVEPGLYDMTGRLLARGFAVLDYDRLGTGDSTSPPASDLTMASDAAVLHQVIGWGRQSAGYRDVDVLAHSMGSAIAAQEAGTWPGSVSRLVLTGMLNLNSPAAGTALQSDVYPASDDPQFPGAGPGYLTTVPGVRGSLFYDSATADPAVIAYDEAHKSVAAATEFATMSDLLGAPPGASITNQVTAPVLIVVGQEDALFCTGAADCASQRAVLSYEQPYFTRAASLIVATIPGTGHDVALHRSAVLSSALVTAWLASVPGNHA